MAAFDEARTLLAALGALDADGRLTDVGRAMAVLPLHPRLAAWWSSAAGRAGWAACVLAALLEERDVLRGPPDDLPTDVAERLRLSPMPTPATRADRGAVRLVRRRAAELARRASGPGRGGRST